MKSRDQTTGKEAGRLEGDASPLHVSARRSEKASSFHSTHMCCAQGLQAPAWVGIPPLPLTGSVSLCNLAPRLFHLLNGRRMILTPKRHNACKLLSTQPPTKCWLILAVI